MTTTTDNRVRIISPDELRDLKGIKFSRSWLWELEQKGQWPKRVRLGAKRYGWIEAEVDEHLQRLAAARGIAA